MSFSWEQGSWPVAQGDEITSDLFEDIRKLCWLLEHWQAGDVDIDTVYGDYNSTNWAGGAAPYGAWSGTYDVGEIMVQYEEGDTQDLYINWVSMSAATVIANPPLDGNKELNSNWRRYPNPNIYHHWDYNSNRWIAWRETGTPAYDFRAAAHLFLPRQTDPEEQIIPLLSKVPPQTSPAELEYQPLEIDKNYITNDIETQYARTNTDGTPPHPFYLTEYVKLSREPDSEDCLGTQWNDEALRNEAYQDHVLWFLEYLGRNFAEEVDSDFTDNWEWWQTLAVSIDNWDVGHGNYSRGNIVKYTDNKYYINQAFHNSADYEPNDGSGIWLTPVYQPDYFGSHPKYADFHRRDWLSNESAYEAVLKHIGSFDWYWDTSYPYIPYWLWENQDDYGIENWPNPVGCWRRCWRYSMGGWLGTYMYPGTGDPPEYYPDKICVTQAVYNTIPGANQKFYQVVNNPPTGSYQKTDTVDANLQGLLDRHVTIPKTESGVETMYEIHHVLINDLWNALKKLCEIDGEEYAYTLTHKKYDYIATAAGPWATKAAAEAALEADTDADTPTINTMTLGVWQQTGYAAGVRYDTVMDFWRNYPPGDRSYRKQIYSLTMTKKSDAPAGLDAEQALVRFGYAGYEHANSDHEFDLTIKIKTIQVTCEYWLDYQRYHYEYLDITVTEGEVYVVLVSGWPTPVQQPPPNDNFYYAHQLGSHVFSESGMDHSVIAYIDWGLYVSPIWNRDYTNADPDY